MANYISKIKLGGASGTQYQVKDAEAVHASDFRQRGAILYGADSTSYTQLIPITGTNKVLMLSNGVPAWGDAATVAGVNNAKLNIQANNGTAIQLFTANSSVDKTVTFKPGSTNGTFKVLVGTQEVGEVAIKLPAGTAAFETSSTLKSYSDTAANSALSSAKTYTNNEISKVTAKLATILDFKGVKETEAEIKAITDPKIGDVWLCKTDSSEWVYIEDSSKTPSRYWEKVGFNINLGTLASKNEVNVVVKYDRATLAQRATPNATVAIASADPQSGETGNYTPKGTVSVDVSVNPRTADLIVLSNPPTLPSMSGSNSSWEFDVADEILTISGGNSNLTFSSGAIPAQVKTVVTNITSATGSGTFTGSATNLSASISGLEHTHQIGNLEAVATTTVSYS